MTLRTFVGAVALVIITIIATLSAVVLVRVTRPKEEELTMAIPEEPPTFTHTLDPKVVWESTPAHRLRRNQLVRVRANGNVCWAHNADVNDCVGPRGTGYSPTQLLDSSGFPFPDAWCGSLIGRVVAPGGKVSYYKIGVAANFTVPFDDAELQVMVNDRLPSLRDNTGNFTVELWVK